MNMLKDLSAQSATMGLLAAFVGFAGSMAVTLQGLISVGASTAEAASGLLALSISMGLCGIWLSIKTRMPVSVAWSTPGAALLVTTGTLAGGFSAAVGAFIVCAVLLIVSGIWSPLGRAVSKIPMTLASAMLAGVLFSLCLAPVKAVADYPLFGAVIFLSWVVAALVHKLLAVPAALLAFMVIVFFGVELPENLSSLMSQNLVTRPVWVSPTFTIEGLIGIALPLFVVTMASQNIPGVAVLKVSGYQPDPGPLFSTTGVFSLLSAPFGGHAVNLAAITAALCAGRDAHEDLSRRYWASIIAGICYLVFGIFASLVTLLVSLAPAVLIQSVAGLALFGAFGGSVASAFSDTETRDASAVTFFITASGIGFIGISGAFWGLLAGLGVYGLHRFRTVA